MPELQERKDIISAQQMFVVKSNTLIQKSSFQLKGLEYKAILYLISKIKPHDEENTFYTFDVIDFCRVCNFDTDSSRTYKTYVKKILRNIMNYTIEIPLTNGGTYLTHWIQNCYIQEDGSFRLRFDYQIAPFLFQLQSYYTKYRLENVLPMRSKYGIRLYELFQSVKSLGSRYVIELDELKERVAAQNYKTFADFRVNVLDPAMKDINEVSDIKASYTVVKTGKRVTAIDFKIYPVIFATQEETFRRLNRQTQLGFSDEVK